MREIRGKTAVVVGAATGIGAGIVRAFAERGASVELGDIDVEGANALARELAQSGAEARATQVDVTDLAGLIAFEADIRTHAGRVDYLFANAGAICLKPFLESTQEDWEWLFGINLFGCVNTIRAFLPGLLRQESPSRIIVTSSINTLRTPPMGGQTIYMATKAAQVGLCKGLERELQGTNVSLSILYPGSVATRIKEKSAANRTGSVEMVVPDSVHRSTPLTPEAVGVLIVDQVAHGYAHIITHPGERDRIVAAQAAILESLDVSARQQPRGTGGV
jgi:NAD(P)-dependent dehydrogenase (short-subunit alcohol dehydrogenase family)